MIGISKEVDSRVFAFGRAEIDTATCELRVAGLGVPIEPRVFDLLVYLIRHRDRVVPKQELIQAVWDGVSVSDSTLPRSICVARQVLERALGSGEYIRTFVRRGYRFIHEVEERTVGAGQGLLGGDSIEAKIASSPRSTWSDRVIGRGDEMRAISDAVRDAASGRGRLLVFEGEPGIGKTQLAEFASDEVEARGGLALWSRSAEEDSAPPFWSWVQLLRAFAVSRSAEAVAQALGGGAEPIVRVVPELAAQPSVIRATSWPEHDRFLLLDAFVCFVRNVARDSLLLLVFDDLQWSDPGSIRALEMLCRALRDLRLLIVVTRRVQLLDEEHPMNSFLGTASTQSAALFLTVRGLDEAQVTELLTVRLGKAPSAALVGEVRRTTGGNPFFVREIADLLRDQDARADREGRFEVPPRVREAIQRRVARMSPQSAELLPVAALCGAEFDVRLLETLTKRSPRDVLSAVSEALADQLLVEMPHRPGQFAFRHPLVREAMRASLSPTQRADLHLRIARVLASTPPRGEDAWLEEVAHHYLEAEPLGAWQEAVEFARRAAERAMRLYGYEQAEALFRRAFAILENHAPNRVAERGELLIRIGEAARSRGANESYTREVFRQAAELGMESEQPTLLGRAALALSGPGPSGDTFSRLNDDAGQERVWWLERAVRVLPDRTELRARCLARLAETLDGPDDLDRRQRLAREALAIAEDLGDRYLFACVLLEFGIVMHDRLEIFEERLAVASRTVDLACELAHPLLEIEARSFKAAVLFEKHQVEASDREMEVCEAIGARVRQPIERARPLAYRAMRAAMQGKFRDAEHISDECARALRTTLPGAVKASCIQHLKMRVIRRDLEGVRDEIDAGLARGYAKAAWKAADLALAVREGDRDRALRELDWLAEDGFRRVLNESSRLVTLGVLADVCVELRATRHAESLYELLEPHRDHAMLVGFLLYYDGSVERPLARLAGMLDRYEEAVASFERALAIHRRVGAEPLVASTAMQYAEYLLDVERDREAARRQLDLVRALVSRLQLDRWIPDLEALEARAKGRARARVS